jgi:hypothetical protein
VLLRQFPAETRGEPGRFRVIESSEDPMAKHPTGTQKRRVNLGDCAVDRADDLEPEKVGQHAVGEIQDCADLLAVVGAASHQRRVGIFDDDDKILDGVDAVLICPETNEVGPRKNAQRGGSG